MNYTATTTELIVIGKLTMDEPTTPHTTTLNSSINEPKPIKIFLNVTDDIPIKYAVPLYGYVLPFLLVVTIVANTLIVVVLSKRHMRTPTNIVLMAMALCDMLTLLFPSPWFIYMYTFGNHSKRLWPCSWCFLWDIMHEPIPNVFHTASVWLTVALAVQRYIYVCHAPLARKFCTMPNVYKCVGYIMFFAFLQQSTRFFEHEYRGDNITVKNETVEVCIRYPAYWLDENVENFYYISYFTFRVLFVNLIPCLTLVVLNLLLFRALKQAQKRRDILLSSSSKKTQKTDCKKMRDANCTTLMLIVVVTAFLIVEIPLAIVVILHMISSTIYIDFLNYNIANTLILFTNFFICLSYPINFAIYCGMSRQFRETFKDLFIRGAVTARNGSSRYSIVNGPRTCTNETVL